MAVNSAIGGWHGLKASLLGAALGLGLLLPFVLLRSLGGGDWKLAGALGACLGPRQLGAVLVLTILLAGAMALCAVIYRRRLSQTLRNIAGIIAALFSFRLPGLEVSIDNPQSTKIPFGVAMSLSVLISSVGRAIGKL